MGYIFYRISFAKYVKNLLKNFYYSSDVYIKMGTITTKSKEPLIFYLVCAALSG